MNASVKIIIKDDYVKQDKTSLLYIQVLLDNNRVRFPLGLSWPTTHFDKKGGRLLPRMKGDKQISDYNLIMQGKLSEINEIITEYRLAKKVLTIEQLKSDFLNWRKRLDFYDFWEKAMRDRYKRKKIEDGTYVCHKASLSKLKQFMPTCTFVELTPKVLDNFRAWMKSALGNMPSTVEKTLKDVRTYVHLAIADGVSMDNPFKVLKVKHITTVPDVLTIEQVRQLLDLYDRPDLEPAWYVVLQHFLFSCFTGLRISDINRVQHEHIVDGCLVFNPHKTRNSKTKTVSIPLHPVALRFLNGNAGRLFDTFSDQYTRRVLKEIGKYLDWKTKMGTHLARHTFGTNFIELGGDVVTLQTYMGHGKIQTTMQYVHLSDRRKKEQIAVFDVFNR